MRNSATQRIPSTISLQMPCVQLWWLTRWKRQDPRLLQIWVLPTSEKRYSPLSINSVKPSSQPLLLAVFTSPPVKLLWLLTHPTVDLLNLRSDHSRYDCLIKRSNSSSRGCYRCNWPASQATWLFGAFSSINLLQSNFFKSAIPCIFLCSFCQTTCNPLPPLAHPICYIYPVFYAFWFSGVGSLLLALRCLSQWLETGRKVLSCSGLSHKQLGGGVSRTSSEQPSSWSCMRMEGRGAPNGSSLPKQTRENG